MTTNNSNPNDIVADSEHRMHTALEVLHRDLSGIRTGRATPALLDRIMVDYYGTPTPITQLAATSVPEARLLVIQPWDKNTLALIEKAILKSDLGITPTNDGRVIRLAFPQLTGERRKELEKMVHKRTEEGKVAIRNCRRDAVDHLKKLEKDKTVSEDESVRVQEKVQKITDKNIAEVEKIHAAKVQELEQV